METLNNFRISDTFKKGKFSTIEFKTDYEGDEYFSIECNQ